MRGRKWFGSVIVLVVLLGLRPANLRSQAPQGNAFVQDYSKGPHWFGHFTAPYRQQTIPPISLENSPRLRDLIHDGKLEISMADALALAIENNLDITVERRLATMSHTAVRQTSAGSPSRGAARSTER